MSENNANHQNAFDVDVSFTRPANATAYAVGQAISTVVGEALKFKIVGSNGGEIVFVNELSVRTSRGCFSSSLRPSLFCRASMAGSSVASCTSRSLETRI